MLDAVRTGLSIDTKWPRIFLCLCFAIAYVRFPWESLGVSFPDLDVYLANVDSWAFGDTAGVEEGGAGLLYFVVDEALWRSLLIVIGTSFSDVKAGLAVVSCFALFVYAIFFTARVNVFAAVFFMLNPLFIDLILSQLRVALAFSLLLIAGSTQRRSIALACAIVAPFIHTASLIFIFYFCLFNVLGLMFPRSSFRVLRLAAFASGALFSLVLAYGLDAVLELVGDRRVGYSASSSSLLFSAFWLAVALFMCAAPLKEISQKNKVIMLFSIAMSSLFFFSSALDVYGSRFVALSLPLIVISITQLPFTPKVVGYVGLGLFQMVQWFYWVS